MKPTYCERPNECNDKICERDEIDLICYYDKRPEAAKNVAAKVEVEKVPIVLTDEEFAKLLAAFVETGEYLSVEVKQENNGVILVDLASFTPLKRFSEYILNNYKP